MNILLVSSEIYPFAKTGGLADVAGALPKSIKRIGHDIRVVLPKYKNVKQDAERIGAVSFELNGEKTGAAIFRSSIDGEVDAYLIEHHTYFDRDSLYGYEDDAERFIFFSRAVLELVKMLKWRPDVIHCNDWQSAGIPTMLRTFYKDDDFFSDVGTAFTIHNLQYQGNVDRDYLRWVGLDWDELTPEKVEYWGSFSLMKAGILYSDVFNTVSKGYAREIQMPEYGYGLDGFIKTNAHRLYGIINGIDVDVWNPKTDPHIAINYDLSSLDVKVENKMLFQEDLALEINKDLPLIGMITRLSDQKGLDIMLPMLQGLLSENIQLVILGTGDDHYMKALERIGLDYANSRMLLTYDEALAHKIYASSDLFLMPSKFEPCGLSQMICMNYGTVPVVRQTGGLADTVIDFTGDKKEGTGFSFVKYSPEELEHAIDRALDVYMNSRRDWEHIQHNGMETNFSWAKSARRYGALYKKALQAPASSESGLKSVKVMK